MRCVRQRTLQRLFFPYCPDCHRLDVESICGPIVLRLSSRDRLLGCHRCQSLSEIGQLVGLLKVVEYDGELDGGEGRDADADCRPAGDVPVESMSHPARRRSFACAAKSPSSVS